MIGFVTALAAYVSPYQNRRRSRCWSDDCYSNFNPDMIWWLGGGFLLLCVLFIAYTVLASMGLLPDFLNNDGMSRRERALLAETEALAYGRASEPDPVEVTPTLQWQIVTGSGPHTFELAETGWYVIEVRMEGAPVQFALGQSGWWAHNLVLASRGPSEPVQLHAGAWYMFIGNTDVATTERSVELRITLIDAGAGAGQAA